MKIKNILAILCAAALISPVISDGTEGKTAECFFWNKNNGGEETVLSEEIPPRRGNGEDSYDDRNPKHDEDSLRPETGETTDETSHCSGRSSVYSWYCPHRKDGQPPEIPSEMSFVENHGGFYLDRNAKDDDKVIYLTFDAGYENGNVEKILDTLKAENVPGAFFILDNLIKTNTDLVKRMADEGHLVCNHTAKHRDMSTVKDKEEFAAELAKLEAIYKEYIGEEMAKFYRPPEGKFSELNMLHADELVYKTIFWSFAYADWDNNKQMSPEKAIDKVLTGTHNGEILLLHPTSATNAAILPELIRSWKSMGYRFGSLTELGAVCGSQGK